VLEDARTWLSDTYRASAREHQVFEARLHTQPDGARTLSTPAELARVATAARARHRGKSPAELRQAAELADYMADRVYGRAVENDEDFKRIEHARHEARTLRELAGDLEARGPAGGHPGVLGTDTVVQLLGPGAAGWAAQGIGVSAAAGRLEIRAADGELLGLIGTGPDGRPAGPVTYRAVIGDSPPAEPRTVPMPAGFLPPDPARCAVGERARWGGTGTGTAGGVQARTARVVYGPGVPCPDCTCCTADGCHRGEGSDCHWSDTLGDYTCPCTGG
jgi:hypothetical protein